MKNLQAFIIGLFTILLFGAVVSANAATWTVTKAANGNDNVCDADCSLREAVFNADSGDTVVFDPNLVGQTFTLGGSEILITKRIMIDGYLSDPNVEFISGEMTSRIFRIQVAAALDLRNAILAQRNGKDSISDPSNGDGGTIIASGGLTMDRVSLRGNRSKFSGAMVPFNSTYHFTNCSITGNSAGTNSAFALRFSGTVYMANTTVSANFDAEGGTGIGAIYNTGTLNIRNSTIALNRLVNGTGGGIFNDGTLNIGNSIVSNNIAAAAPDINQSSGTITSIGGNLVAEFAG